MFTCRSSVTRRTATFERSSETMPNAPATIQTRFAVTWVCNCSKQNNNTSWQPTDWLWRCDLWLAPASLWWRRARESSQRHFSQRRSQTEVGLWTYDDAFSAFNSLGHWCRQTDTTTAITLRRIAAAVEDHKSRGRDNSIHRRSYEQFCLKIKIYQQKSTLIWILFNIE